MHPSEIAQRAKAVRYRYRELAEAAGIREDTAARTLSGRRRDGTDPRFSTLNALEAALIAEEKRLRDYLVELHGIPNAAPQASEAA